MTERSRFIDVDGTVLGELPSDEVGDCAEDLEIPRDDLTHVLTQSLPASASLIMSESIDRLHDDGEGVDVTFVSGTSDRVGLVVGANGMHSLTRKLAFGLEEDYLTHLGFYGVIRNYPRTQARYERILLELARASDRQHALSSDCVGRDELSRALDRLRLPRPR